jgi:hypothetical protein
MNAHNCWFYHAWGPTWIEIHWKSIWLKDRLHMTSQYTWGFVSTLHEFGGVLGRPLDTSFWVLTISRSRLLVLSKTNGIGDTKYNIWCRLLVDKLKLIFLTVIWGSEYWTVSLETAIPPAPLAMSLHPKTLRQHSAMSVSMCLETFLLCFRIQESQCKPSFTKSASSMYTVYCIWCYQCLFVLLNIKWKPPV